MRYIEIYERAVTPNVFGLAKKAYLGLGHAAKVAIDSWETSNWIGGPLEQHIIANDEVADEITAAFAPVRAQLPETVTLYRGIVLDSAFKSWETKHLTSWSTEKRVAELFAGLRYGEKWQSLLYPELSDDEITQAAEKYSRTGFLKFKNRYYVRNKDVPKYYDIYDRSKQYVTDGDNLERDLRRDNETNKEMNAEKRSRSHIMEEEIHRDRIVWITNRLNCKEFIVR